MPQVTMRQMLEAGVHFGHQTRYWNPRMAPYIFGARGRIHIINLEKTMPLFSDAMNFISAIAQKRGTVLFVGTKRSAREAVKEEARDVVTQLRDFEPSFLCIHTAGGETRLPAELAQFLLAVTANVANGSVIGVQTLPEELTTTTAAQPASRVMNTIRLKSTASTARTSQARSQKDRRSTMISRPSKGVSQPSLIFSRACTVRAKPAKISARLSPSSSPNSEKMNSNWLIPHPRAG